MLLYFFGWRFKFCNQQKKHMLLPVKFVAVNIFLAGVTAGAVCSAAVVIVLSDTKRKEQLQECAAKMRYNCRTMFNMKPNTDSFWPVY